MTITARCAFTAVLVWTSCHGFHIVQRPLHSRSVIRMLARQKSSTQVPNRDKQLVEAAPAPSAREGSLSDAEAPSRTLAQAQLLGCAALWGTYPAAIKLLYTSEGAPLDASLVTLLRFAIMAIASVSALGLSGRGLPSFNAPEEPWPDQLVKRIPSSLYACAIELGLLGFIGTLCNASGLQTVSALQGGIFLSFINVFTPTVSSFAGATEKERNVPSSIWIGSASALAVSAFALIPDDAQGSEAFSLSGALDTILTPGALLLLGAALSFSSAKVRLGAHLGAQDPEFLAVTRLVVQFLFALIGFLALDEPEAVGAAVNGFLHTGSSSSSSSGLADGQTNGLFAGAAAWASSVSSRQATLIVVSAIASGTGATWLQAQGQRQVPATEAQLIYSLTPIFSALWAFLLLNEPISLHETAGGAGLIIVAYLTVGGGGRKQAER